MKHLLWLCALGLGACTSQERIAHSDCELGARYVEAANRGDVSLVLDALHVDIEAVFLAAEPGRHEIIKGRDAVVEGIKTYTQQCTSCRSEAICLHESPAAQYLVERVRFIDQDGVERVQSAPLVLELENARIRRLVYYPALRQSQ